MSTCSFETEEGILSLLIERPEDAKESSLIAEDEHHFLVDRVDQRAAAGDRVSTGDPPQATAKSVGFGSLTSS